MSTWPDADAARRSGRPAVLPFGALEQHGPHLPLATDTLLATRLAERVADSCGAWLLPAVPLGHTAGNDGFPGTVTLRFDTVRAIAVDVGTSLKRSGFPCCIVVNGDFGNRGPLQAAARELRDSVGLPTLVLDYPGLEEVASALLESEPAGPGLFHADELETSLVLAIRPDLVRRELAAPSYPPIPPTFGSEPSDLAALSPTGVFGDPRPASASKGGRILDALASRAVAVVEAFLAGCGATPRAGGS